MGPIEIQIRRSMRGGSSMSRAEARELGALGPVIWDRYVRRGIARVVDGRAFLVERTIDPGASAAVKAEREAREAIRRLTQEERERAAADVARREAQRREQLRRLDACRTPEERARVIEEGRALALADRALKQLHEVADAPPLDVFGIEMEV